MKILVFIHSMQSGGAERVTSSLANQWSALAGEVTIVTQTSAVDDFYELNPAVKRISLDSAKDSAGIWVAALSNITRVALLRNVVRTENPDVLLGMMTSANVLVTLAGLGTRVSTVVCERTYPPQLSVGPFWSRLRRWTYPLASRVTMLTSEGLHWLEQEIPRARGLVIPNPIPYPLPVNEPQLAPESVQAPDRKMLLAVGRMSEEKGFDRLIQAFSSLADQHPQWDLVILGDGPLRSVLTSQIQSLGLTSRVALPGRAGNVGAWYERADLYVLSSRVEGFPNTLGEAMAHGCAAVSFDCDTGPRDLIRHEVDGLLVPPGDTAAMAQALDRLMRDDTLRAQMAARAIEVRERYSMEHVLAMWEQLFADIQRAQTHSR